MKKLTDSDRIDFLASFFESQKKGVQFFNLPLKQINGSFRAAVDARLIETRKETDKLMRRAYRLVARKTRR